LYFFFKTFVI
jgi:hypothetical protein